MWNYVRSWQQIELTKAKKPIVKTAYISLSGSQTSISLH